MATASRYGSLLESFHKEIIEKLDVNSLLSTLITKRVLFSSERDQFVTNDTTNETKAELLCSVLLQRGPHSFNQFINALREEGQERHRELASILAREQNRINRNTLVPPSEGDCKKHYSGTPAEVSPDETRSVELNKDVNIISEIEILGQQLGRGAYASVYTVKYAGTICAAKEIHSILIQSVSAEERQKVYKQFVKECDLSRKMIHPNIVQFLGIYYPTEHSLPVIIMELMDCSLTDYLKNHSKIYLSAKISILHDVSMGLSYLHTKDPPIVHRDVSSDNILLKYTENEILPIAKIANLGMAQETEIYGNKAKPQLTQLPETAAFMPPEASNAPFKYSTSLDVFSLGCVVIHTLSHEWPTPMTLMETNGKIITEVERRQKYLDKITGEAAVLKPVIKACLNDDPKYRPSVAFLQKDIAQLMTSQTMNKSVNKGREINIDSLLREAETLVDHSNFDKEKQQKMDGLLEVAADEPSDNVYIKSEARCHNNTKSFKSNTSVDCAAST